MRYAWIAALVAFGGLAGCDENMAMDDAGSAPLRTGSAQAEQACVALVNQNYGRDVASVVSSDFSEANTEVMISAEGETFRCLSSEQGEVADLAQVG